MPIAFPDLIKSLATKAKIDLAKPEFQAVLTAGAEVEVPDEFADQLESQLLTPEAAVANQDIRKRIQAEVLNGEDAWLNSQIGDLDFEDATREEIKGIKDTRLKQRKTIEKLNERIKTAKNKGDKPTEEALKKALEDAKAELRSKDDVYTAKIKALEEKNEEDYKNFRMRNLLGAKQYALPDSTPQDVKEEFALMCINKKLAQKNLKVVKNGTDIKLVTADGLDYYDDKSNLVSLPSFIDGALAADGLLKNNDSQAKPANKTGAPKPFYGQGSDQNAPSQTLAEVSSAIDAMLQGQN